MKNEFFTNKKAYSNKYFTFDHVIDDDNIIIITNNITLVNTKFGQSPILMVGNNKAIYLKEWQIRPVMNYGEGLYAFAVKLNRNFCKIYTFKNDFEGMAFEKEFDFDELKEIAESQNDSPVRKGWGRGMPIEYRHQYR